MGCRSCGGADRSERMQRAARDLASNPQPIPPEVMYEVQRDGQPTGRKFNSIVSAQTYAARVGGTVHPLG